MADEEFNEIDNLLSEYEGERAFQLLSETYNTDNLSVDVLCRFANAIYIRANCEEDHKKRIELLKQGRDFSLKALKLEPENVTVLKWCATLTGVLAEQCNETKERIKLGHEFKTYLDKALELDGGKQYPELYHMRGRFRYQVAGLGLIERSLATVFFGSIPSATYEEALSDFLKSEENTPDELENTLFIGKCYKELGQPQKAVSYLQKLAHNEPVDSIDCEHIDEAIDLLKKLDPTFVLNESSCSDTD